MTLRIKTISESETEDREDYDKLPDYCPICHKGIDPRIRFAYRYGSEAQVIYQCPRDQCHQLFIGYYWDYSGRYNLRSVAPIKHPKREFSEYIYRISQPFVDIFNEADNAESIGLSKICGAGYRKALEFLIKDYAISRTPDEETKEKIKNKWLGVVINDHVDEESIRTTASLAAWLGNDETHYVRIWTDMDIEDMKTLIELTVRWIESEEMTRNYQERMTSRGNR